MADLTNLSSLKVDKANIKNAIVNFIVPLVCLLISILLFFLVIYPSFINIPVLQLQLSNTEKLRDSLTEKQNKINRLADFKSILEEDSALVDRVMPAEEDVPGILDQLDLIARNAGLNVDRLSYSFGEATTATKDTAAPVFSSVLVTLGAEGSASQMLTFLQSAENAARVINVSNYRYNLSNVNDNTTLSLVFTLTAPFMKVQSNAVTDDPIVLDLTNTRFTDFITKVKGLTFYKELAPSQQSEARKSASETSESTSSAQ